MIVIDTSALLAIVLKEKEGRRCVEVLAVESPLLMSAGTLLEVLIVAGRLKIRDVIIEFIDALKPEIVGVSETSARRASEAYERWGKGVHKAKLNYGDCFAYELAKSRSCPLLFIGNDFAKTDVMSAL